MIAKLNLLLGIVLLAAGTAGLFADIAPLIPYALPFALFGAVILLLAGLRRTFYRSNTPFDLTSTVPQPLRLGPLDWIKAAIDWLDAFKRTYVIEPGLYYTGDQYDRDAPLLVTANYHLSVFLLVRHVRAFNARILVIDTDGINVWCGAGKGMFSNAAIHTQLDRYDRNLITDRTWLTLVLPKFSLAGIDIRALRDEKIKPVIGPLYAKDLPAYLAAPPLRDCDDDIVHFGLQMRAFAWLPGLIQFLGYSLLLLLPFIIVALIWETSVPFGLVTITAVIATAYPLLFPWLPGRAFTTKGLWLAGLLLGIMGLMVAFELLPMTTLLAAAPFTLAVGLFFALSFTGNSAVSNYTKVRRETARFLVPDLLLFAASIAGFVVMEVIV